MRANDALTRFEKKTNLRADCTSADSPLPGARTVRTRTREHVWLWWKLDVTGGQSGTLTQIVPERVFSLVGLMICAADGPPLGRGRSAGYLTVCTRDIVVSGGFQG